MHPMLFGDLEPSESYLYHYTSATTLAKILDRRVLRFGPYGATNDPRENKAWLPSFSVPTHREVDNDEWFRLLEQADRLLRGRAHVGCFTMDRGRAYDGHHQRGYGRARMWDQYAAKHEGACLIFDSARLTAVVREAVEGEPSVLLRSGGVSYVDEDSGLARFHLSIDEIDASTLERVCDDYLDEHWRDLFLAKNTDWASEDEYRFLVIGSTTPATYVPIASALVGLVLGDAFPETEASVLGVRLERMKCPTEPVIAICHWRNGVPDPLPFLPQVG